MSAPGHSPREALAIICSAVLAAGFVLLILGARGAIAWL